MGNPNWYQITRTLQQLDPDEQRSKVESIPVELDGCTLLLIKKGEEPVKEYIYGDGEGIVNAGQLAGFDARLVEGDEEPVLPDGVNSAAHPLIPFRARLNSKSNMEKMRTNYSGVRTSIEKVMPPDSYVSVTLRNQGYFEQIRIRNWISDEYNAVEDSSELASTNTMCARVSFGCRQVSRNRQLAQKIGQIICPLISNMSSHASRPKFGLLFVSMLLEVLSVIWSVCGLARGYVMDGVFPLFHSAWGFGIALPLLAVTLVVFLFLMLLSCIPFVYIPRPQIAGGAVALMLYLLLGLLPLPTFIPILFVPLLVFAFIRWKNWTLWDDIFQTPRRYYAIANDRGANESDNQTRLGVRTHKERVSAYGAQRTTLILSPIIVSSVFTPVTQGVAMKQELHPVPEVLSHDGIFLGKDDTGRNCYLDPSQLFGGIAINGEAGSGKTVLTHGISQWAISARETTSPKIWGRDSRIIHFWMKDDTGVNVLERYRKRHGFTSPQRVVYLADPNSVCLDMLGMKDGNNAMETAASVAKTMRYSFDDGDILNDSQNIITQALTIGVAVDRYVQEERKHNPESANKDWESEIVKRCHQLEQSYPGAEQLRMQLSPIGWAVVALCGSDGQAGSAKALGHVCRALSMELKSGYMFEEMTYAARAAEQLYGRPDAAGHTVRSDRDILAKTNASLNKVNQFLPIEHMFTARRGKVTWTNILDHAGDYHIVLAPHNGYSLPERMDKILGGWLMYRFWNTVFAHCKDWDKAGKWTMLVCDELSLLANGNDGIMPALREQGRSFGLLLVFATQYPTQLSDAMLDSFIGYSTFITYNTTIPRIADMTAKRLTNNDGEDGWRSGAVMNLPRYAAAVRTRTQEQLQPTFLVHVNDFDNGYRNGDMDDDD